MNAGKVLFAQLMDFLPWSSFARGVARYGGDRRVRSLACAEQFRAMAFAQLTFRESLRDIEACLGARPNKLYHLGFRSPVRRSTLAEANESRDWRIHAELAQRLIVQARSLYAQETLGVELNSAAYALDSTTIDLCMSLFPWAHFRSTKSAVKMHTLLDLHGSIPAFILVTTGDTHDVHMLDQIAPEAGAFYVMDRGYLDFARLYQLHLAGAFFVTRAKSNLDASRIYSASSDRTTGIVADQTIALNGYLSQRDYPSRAGECPFKRRWVFNTCGSNLQAAVLKLGRCQPRGFATNRDWPESTPQEFGHDEAPKTATICPRPGDIAFWTIIHSPMTDLSLQTCLFRL
jgi:hypothetical protein